MYRRFPLFEENKDGNQGGGGFDPAAFKADLLAAFKTEMHTTVNGAVGNLRKELTKKVEPVVEAEAEVKPDDKMTPSERRMQARLDAMEKERATDKAEILKERESARGEKRKSTLTGLLSEAGVAPNRMKSAMAALGVEVKFDEAGQLVGGDDETPITEFVTAWIGTNEHFLPPVNKGGAGATSGSGARVKPLTLEEIKPGMSKEARAAAFAAIGELL